MKRPVPGPSVCHIQRIKGEGGRRKEGGGGRRLRKEEGGRRGVLSGRYGRRYFRGKGGKG